ncbi:MAG: aminopeptidase, partial [Janthinobacterium lividum]
MMKKQRICHALTAVAVLAAAALLAGCAQLGYYVQAAQGQFALLAAARPIDDWLAEPGLAPALRQKLAAVREMRTFAARELGLPDNGSYKRYADLQRPFALWNVVAAPALELKAVEWCFPIAGCVNYRGYYDRSDAQAFAEGLRRQGYDV